jgi:hypothetical protein
MPSLLPTVWTTAHPVVPYVWCCSTCEAVFDVGAARRASLTQEQIDQVNRQFEVHCKQTHPGSFPVVGLPCAPAQN